MITGLSPTLTLRGKVQNPYVCPPKYKFLQGKGYSTFIYAFTRFDIAECAIYFYTFHLQSKFYHFFPFFIVMSMTICRVFFSQFFVIFLSFRPKVTILFFKWNTKLLVEKKIILIKIQNFFKKR